MLAGSELEATVKFRVTICDQRADEYAREDVVLGIYEVDDYDGELSEDECADYLIGKLSRLVDRVE